MESEKIRQANMTILQPSVAPRYVIVSPAKDEERYIELILRSVTRQTLKPVLWIIVDDGSKDSTVTIVNRYADSYPFIRLVRNPNSGVRQTGSAVIRAFNFGCQSIGETEHAFIVKLDCDLSFGPDYFENLLEKFTEDPKLGIASGVYFEQDKTGVWNQVTMPAYHAAGACKVIRKACFEAIGGFIAAAGWDTVDEIRAMAKGWKTTHFADRGMKHHKPEGSGIGAIKTSVMHGEIYYLTGGSLFFFLLKVLHRLKSKPYGVGALALVRGYLKAFLSRKTPLVTKTEARCYRSLLNGRLLAQAKNLLVRH
jgi:poly-beta-1,6-N-acetyl-D-glucosamine synthase